VRGGRGGWTRDGKVGVSEGGDPIGLQEREGVGESEERPPFWHATDRGPRDTIVGSRVLLGKGSSGGVCFCF